MVGVLGVPTSAIFLYYMLQILHCYIILNDHLHDSKENVCFILIFSQAMYFCIVLDKFASNLCHANVMAPIFDVSLLTLICLTKVKVDLVHLLKKISCVTFFEKICFPVKMSKDSFLLHKVFIKCCLHTILMFLGMSTQKLKKSKSDFTFERH